MEGMLSEEDDVMEEEVGDGARPVEPAQRDAGGDRDGDQAADTATRQKLKEQCSTHRSRLLSALERLRTECPGDKIFFLHENWNGHPLFFTGALLCNACFASPGLVAF
jgi:hypothetical protein